MNGSVEKRVKSSQYTLIIPHRAIQLTTKGSFILKTTCKENSKATREKLYWDIFFFCVCVCFCFVCLFVFISSSSSSSSFFSDWRFLVGARAGILGVFLFRCTCVLCATDDEVEKALVKLP